jgi:hypothetical protein
MLRYRPALLTTGAAVSALLASLISTPTTAAHESGRAALPRTLVVEAGDVSASIATAPFGLEFRDGNGKTVLGSVEGGGLPMPSLHLSDLLGTLGDIDVSRRATRRSRSPRARS